MPGSKEAKKWQALTFEKIDADNIIKREFKELLTLYVKKSRLRND